jgi:hypothetical protein
MQEKESRNSIKEMLDMFKYAALIDASRSSSQGFSCLQYFHGSS